MRLAHRLVDWLIDRLFPGNAPIPLSHKPVEWEQRHARHTVAELLERQKRNEIPPPPPRGKRKP